MSYAAILISRQGMHPSSDSDWVIQARKAAEYIYMQNLSICSSVGMKTWELVTSLASIYKIPIKVILPLPDKTKINSIKEEIYKQFNLDKRLSVIEPLYYPDKDKANSMRLRDKAVILSSDILMPISLRKRSSLTELLKFNQKRINKNFMTEFESVNKRQAYVIEEKDINPEISLISQKYLIHWTRSANQKWPTEKEIDYYSSILSNSRYPRGAFETLKNILNRKAIISSSKNMPHKTKTVSFSGLVPAKAAKLMRWRKRYCQMSLEPYGIGIKSKLAEKLSIFKVHYVQKNQISKFPDDSKWLTQSVGQFTDWRSEYEYRHKGDFLLKDMSLNDIVIFTKTKEESDEISRRYQIKSVNMLK